MPLMLGEAAKAAGKNRTTILRAIKAGKLSASHDEASGAWLIEPAELHRVYPPSDAHASAPQGNAHLRTGEIHELRGRLAERDSLIAAHERTIEDLRRRLDAESEERRRLTAVLADQRASPTHAGLAAAPDSSSPARRRRWWRPWRRSGRGSPGGARRNRHKQDVTD